MATSKEILLSWNVHGTLKSVSKELGCSWMKIAKTLSSEGIIINETHERILDCHYDGMNAEQISERLKISIATVNAYLPRTRPVYNENLSANALRIKKCRERTKSPT